MQFKTLKRWLRDAIALSVGMLAIACSAPSQLASPSPPANEKTAVTGIPQTNLTRGCVADYQPDVDYFPDKVELDYATGLEIEYHNHYKVVSVLSPWPGAKTRFSYVLVQCGTPIPSGFKREQVVEVPVTSAIALSTTYLPHLERLDLLDRLLAVSVTKQVYTPKVRERIAEGRITEVGSNQSLNLEQVLALNPDLIFTYGTGNPQFDIHPKLTEVGLPVAINAEYVESHPLGRAEWLKFIAAFFNREARAADLFSQMETRYQTLANLTRTIESRPTVFTGFNRNGTWYVPGGKSYVARFFADAGADYLWSDLEVEGSLPLDWESVYDRAGNAQFWLNANSEWQSLDSVIADDERYRFFAALARGRVFNNNARLNEYGGNDYWESGTANPDVILADLIQIFHPHLLSDRELVYYRQLE